MPPYPACRLGESDAESAAAIQALTSIVREDWPKAASQSGLDTDALRRFGRLIPELTPAPSAGFAQATSPLIPDLIMEFAKDGSAQVSLSRGLLPDIRIDDSVLASGSGDAEVKSFLENHLTSARGLLRALEFRGSTLLRVGSQIVRDQISFFRDGPAKMHPLSRLQLAEKLNLHPSTVGRAIAGKFLAHPGGTLPLSAFFPTEIGADHVSSFAVQHRIAELVSSEHRNGVLADEAIAALLQREGVDIARRTVAKYRRRLNIPASHLRKRQKRAL